MPRGRLRGALAERWNALWFTNIAPEIYSVLRILFGAAGAVSLLGLLDVELFWSCDGLVASRGGAVCEYATGAGVGWLPGAAVLGIAALSFAATAVGYHSTTAVVCAFGSISLMAAWNDLPMSAAHQVLRSLLFCLIWADCGRVWSIDAWRSRRGGRPLDAPIGVPIWPLRLVQIQVAAVYLVTGLWKLNNVMWRDGSAVHYVLQNPQFRRFALLSSPTWDVWTTLATYVTLAWELGFALLVFHPRTRRWALASGVVMHLGMWALLELGPFSLMMVASYAAFLDPAFVRRWLPAPSVQGSPAPAAPEAAPLT
jgi:hypothetical protein